MWIKKDPMGLDIVELIVEVEEKFNISIPDEEAASLATVGQVVDYVYTHQKSDAKLEKSEIQDRVIDLVSDKTGISKEKIALHHSFTNDLGMD